MSPEFKELILGIIENNIPVGQIRVSRLGEPSVDPPIMEELREQAKIALAHFYFVLEQLARKARAGKQIPFFIVCYVIDGWAFDANWYGGGWGLRACSVSVPTPWNADNHILSRNSLLSSAN